MPRVSPEVRVSCEGGEVRVGVQDLGPCSDRRGGDEAADELAGVIG